MPISGSEFVAQYAKKGFAAWEAAALALAEAGELTPWPWVDLPLTIPGSGDTAVVKVSSDVLSVGPLEDHVRLPLLPGTAQSILNLTGSLTTTPWLEYQIWRAAPVKLQPIPMVPNKGADLAQYAEHSRLIDEALAAQTVVTGTLVSGIKKGVVVSNIYQPRKVIIFGWYIHFLEGAAGHLTDELAPDVFDDHRALGAKNRQPIQPNSNAHGDFYVDYSHGIRAVAPYATVNGQPMATIDLYRHPVLSRFVSNEGPLKVPRYPAKIPPAVPPAPIGSSGNDEGTPPDTRFYSPPIPGITELGLDALARTGLRRRRGF